MLQIDSTQNIIRGSIVYYGPAYSGKTKNLEMIYQQTPPEYRSEWDYVDRGTDRLLFLDFIPTHIEPFQGMYFQMQLGTACGEVQQPENQQSLLQNVSGIIFVADSQSTRFQENLNALGALQTDLATVGLDLFQIPLVFQYNKRDLPDLLSIDVLHDNLNQWNAPYFEASAAQGIGVFEPLTTLIDQIVQKFQTHYHTPSSPPMPSPLSAPQESEAPSTPKAPPLPTSANKLAFGIYTGTKKIESAPSSSSHSTPKAESPSTDSPSPLSAEEKKLLEEQNRILQNLKRSASAVSASAKAEESSKSSKSSSKLASSSSSKSSSSALKTSSTSSSSLLPAKKSTQRKLESLPIEVTVDDEVGDTDKILLLFILVFSLNIGFFKFYSWWVSKPSAVAITSLSANNSTIATYLNVEQVDDFQQPAEKSTPEFVSYSEASLGDGDDTVTFTSNDNQKISYNLKDCLKEEEEGEGENKKLWLCFPNGNRIQVKQEEMHTKVSKNILYKINYGKYSGTPPPPEETDDSSSEEQ
jgi:hypothetical protein